jgi:hypothetical protein
MAHIVRNVGDPKNTVTVDGIPVHREDMIFLSSHNRWYRVLPTSMHFCYKDPTHRESGSTILCTCGAPASVYGHEGYKRFSSFMGTEVIACNNLIQYGVHADGSHE